MEKLAKLAMLELDDVKNQEKDIKNLIKMADVLNEIECDCINTFDYVNAELRDDTVTEVFTKKEMTKNTYCDKEGYIILRGGLV